MTDLRKAAELAAYEVPLPELLEGVPENARLVIDSEGGMSTNYIPVGQYCRRAASALRQAPAEPEQKREWDSEFLAGVEWAAKYIEAKRKEKNT